MERFFSGRMPASISIEEVSDAADRVVKIIDIRQEHESEMVTGYPVKSGSLYYQDSFLGQ